MSVHPAKLFMMVVLCAALGVGTFSCSSDEDPTGPDPSGPNAGTLAGTYTGWAYFGIAGAPQPIEIRIEGSGTTFGGEVVTDNVPDGEILDGSWDGITASWTTRDALGGSATWAATLNGTTLEGHVTNAELNFSVERT